MRPLVILPLLLLTACGPLCVTPEGVTLVTDSDCHAFLRASTAALEALPGDLPRTHLEGVTVEVVFPGDADPWRTFSHKGEPKLGVYTHSRRAIVVNTDRWEHGTLAHELVHAMEGRNPDHVGWERYYPAIDRAGELYARNP